METLTRTRAAAPLGAAADSLPAAGVAVGGGVAVGSLPARRALRGQIARLERRMAAMSPRFVTGVCRGDGPAVLSLGDLERIRDELVARLAAAERAAAGEAAAQAKARVRVEAMLADPAAHRWERVTRAELGEPGCGAWHVRPRFGLLGMLAGWWEVKLSSGCPLAMASRTPQDRLRRGRRHAAVELVAVTVFLGVIVAMCVWFFFLAGSPMAPYN